MSIRAADPDPEDPSSGTPVDPLIDHLVYATPDLERTVAEFRDRAGLDPAEGGRHLGLGTRNFLVGLGPRRYLEIIGPDVENPAAAGVPMPFGLDGLTLPTLVTWAVHPADIRAAVGAAAAAGADLGPIREMRRARPDGVVLAWRLALPEVLPFGGAAPFVIDWGASPHPADADRPPADLRTVTAAHPDPDRLRAVLDALGVSIPVVRGDAGLTAVIDTPRGPVELG